jgi:NAD-dependent dihydropyrimidine dehydrogenase PreA subunit
VGASVAPIWKCEFEIRVIARIIAMLHNREYLPMETPVHCRQPPGHFVPFIDRNRCEGKGPCVNACPHDVLGMGVLAGPQRRQLSLIGRLKAFAHGGRQAFVIDAQRCRACGDCVRVCPENAITLVRRSVPT